MLVAVLPSFTKEKDSCCNDSITCTKTDIPGLALNHRGGQIANDEDQDPVSTQTNAE
jgi:hypothetical protein